MNNLKKVLALGLALVMLLGMFTIASAATTTKMVASDLTDWSSVEHKDAVALMVDLGIINGKDDGSFDPTANITRGEWAKMVYYAATGDDNADAYLGAGTTLTDISGHWAESYICYLASTGRVSGDGTGHFNPDNNVTVVEACKMMLTTLGYDAEDRKYQNDAAWSGNVMTDAKRNGLMDNVDTAQTALVPLTRENAAEIVYNALQANTVEGVPQWDSGNKYITTYTKLSPLGYDVFGVIRVEATVKSIDTNGYAVFDNLVTYPEGINVSGTNLKEIEASADVVGETVSVFVEVTNAKYDEKNGEITNPGSVVFRKVRSTSVARGASAADVTYTGGFNWYNITNTAKDEYVAAFATDTSNNVTTTFYINGELKTKAEFEANIPGKIWDTNNAEAIPGLVVEFYLNDDGNISVVKAYEHSVAQLTGDVETRTTSAGELQVRVPGVVATWTDASKVSGYQGLVEDDVVLYYSTPTGSSKSYVMEKAEKVTGKVTAANSSNQITVNGVKYKRTGLTTVTAGVTEGYSNSGTKTFANWADRDNEFDFYLDKSGSVCFIEQVTDAVSKDKIALVMAAEWTGTDMTTSTGLLQAKLLFIDGTTEIVTVSKLDDQKVVTTHSTNATTAAKEIIGGPKEGSKLTDAEAIDGEEPAIAKLHDSKIGSDAPAFYNYKVVDGKYELTKVVAAANPVDDDWLDTEPISGAKIEKKTDFSNSNTSYAADSKTTFLVAKGEEGEEEYYSYTGFKNVPEMSNASGLAVGTFDNSGIAKYVFLTTINYSDDVPDGYVFVYNNKWDEDPANEDTYLINVVDEDGNITQLSVTENIRDIVSRDNTSNLTSWTTSATNTFVGKFVQIDSIDEKGIVSDMHAVADYSSMANLTAIGNEVVRASDGTSLDYDNITKFVFIDLAVDDGDNENTKDDDTLVFSDAGVFNPENFFDATNVETTPLVNSQLVSAAQKTYDSVQVVMIHADNSTTADYVYVLRVVW